MTIKFSRQQDGKQKAAVATVAAVAAVTTVAEMTEKLIIIIDVMGISQAYIPSADEPAASASKASPAEQAAD